MLDGRLLMLRSLGVHFVFVCWYGERRARYVGTAIEATVKKSSIHQRNDQQLSSVVLFTLLVVVVPSLEWCL